MDPATHQQLARALHGALRSRSTIDPLTTDHPAMTIPDAYAVSKALLERRLAEGERLIGKKIGVTSEPVQRMLDVHQPDFGWLTDRMQVANHGDMPISTQMIQPRAEGELAFILGARLEGEVSADEVRAATASVHPCFEVVDSRVHDWKVRIQDTIADNASSGMFVLGAPVDPAGVDFEGCEMVVHKNGTELSRGFGAAALGSPLNAVAWLALTMSRFGHPLEAGDIILSGSLVPLEPVERGDRMSLRLSGVGTCSVNFV